MAKRTFFFIFISAFLLRLFIAPIYHHADADSFFYWAKYLWEKKDFLFFLGKAVPNAVTANYPPVFYYLLFIWRGFYDLTGRFLWLLNIKVPFFPSNLIFRYQSYEIGVAFNKIPGILADLGCAYLIFKIAENLGAKKILRSWAMALFLFLPATWYNSAYWGQIESLYSFFLLLGFYLSLKDRFLWATGALAVSGLIKPTGFFVLPAFLLFSFKKKKVFDFLLGGLTSLVVALILYFPFQPINTLPWAIKFYFTSFRGELNYLTANAFNFWSLIFGFDQRPDSSLFLSVPFSTWGFLIFLVILVLVSIKFWSKTDKKNLIYSSFLLAFAAFLFLPRMHERYFYTAMTFLVIMAGLSKKWLYSFIVLSLIHFLNLYHFWWYPKIPVLISLLSNLLVVRGIILVNLILFFSCLIRFLKDGFVNNHC